jgi:hypothetical protein
VIKVFFKINSNYLKFYQQKKWSKWF